MTKKIYLITGATGYLGSKILRELVKFEKNIICLKRKSSITRRIIDLHSKITLLNIEDINFKSFFHDYHIHTIIHCATDYGRKNIDPSHIIDANLILPLKLLHYGTIGGISSFINTDTVLSKNISSYSLSKKQFLDWLVDYSNRICTINISLQHFYGPGDNETKFTTFIIRSLINSEPFIKLTKGEQLRDFIFIDDVVDAFIRIIQSQLYVKCGHHSFEVGTNTQYSIKDFVLLAKSIIGNNNTYLDFGALPYRDGEIMNIKTNSENLISMGWKCKYSLEDGLSITIFNEMEMKN